MSEVNRRTFLKTVATAATALPAVAVGACAPAGTGTGTSLDDGTLRALGEIVLPGELGADGIGRAVTGFQAWLAGYRPAAARRTLRRSAGEESDPLLGHVEDGDMP